MGIFFSSFSYGQSVSANNAQIQDLIVLGYPLIYEFDVSKDSILSITYKNITNATILFASFIVEWNDNGDIKRTLARIDRNTVVNASANSRWQFPKSIDLSKPINVVEIIVSLNGVLEVQRYNEFQAQHMLAKSRYSQGQIAVEIEAEKQRVEAEAEARRIAEAERQRIAREEAEARRVAEAETRRQAEAERQRVITAEAEARRQAEAEKQTIAQEEEVRRKAEGITAIRKAIASRNADIIMESLVNNRNNLRGEVIIDEAYLEVAKIITRNNNVRLEWLGAVLDRLGGARLSTVAEVTRTLDRNIVYFQPQLLVSQFIDGGILINTGYNDTRRNIYLYPPIPNINRIGNLVQNVYMRYVGTTPFRQENGSIVEVPSFDVLYHYQF